MGGENTPSGDITIDDVVKFIHDDIKNESPDMFPYTTWDSIPNYEDVGNGEICKTNDISTKIFSMIILNIPYYVVGIKSQLI